MNRLVAIWLLTACQSESHDVHDAPDGTGDPEGRFRMIELGTLGGPSSRATDIDQEGRVVGWAMTAELESHAFLWEDGVMINLSASIPDGEFGIHAVDINDRREVLIMD